MKDTEHGYQCVHCEKSLAQWVGKCPQCMQWNTIVEKKRAFDILERDFLTLNIVSTAECSHEKLNYLTLSLLEIERVLGGGLVEGSVILLSGEPGIGKSTLVLQIAHSIVFQERKVLYITGEESVRQVASRVARLEIKHQDLFLLQETSWEKIKVAIERTKAQMVIIDSIQTTYSEESQGSAGSESQVKNVSQAIVEYMKSKGITCIITGQITKHGSIAGPKYFEHIVDTVLYFEGERSGCNRYIRALKNRFGTTNEVGCLHFSSKGLSDASEVKSGATVDFAIPHIGTSYTLVQQGSRLYPLKIESLMRSRVGNHFNRSRHYIDPHRLSMLVALLEGSSSFKESQYEMYLNVVGKYMQYHYQSDLAIIASLFSSYLKKPLPTHLIVLGEVSLNGGIYELEGIEKKMNYFKLLGVKTVWANINHPQAYSTKLNIVAVKSLGDLVRLIQSPS